jgi:hypothetical protein
MVSDAIYEQALADIERLEWTAAHRWKEAEKLEAERDKLRDENTMLRQMYDNAIAAGRAAIYPGDSNE